MNILFLHATPATKNALQSFLDISREVNQTNAQTLLASASKLDRLSGRVKSKPFSSAFVAALFIMLSFFIWFLVKTFVPVQFRPAADMIPAILAIIGNIGWIYVGMRTPPTDFKAVAFRRLLNNYHGGDFAEAKICLNDSELLYKNARAVWGAIYLSAVAALMAHAKIWTVFFSYGISKGDSYDLTDILATVAVVIVLVWYEMTVAVPAAWIDALLVASKNHELKPNRKGLVSPHVSDVAGPGCQEIDI